MLRHIDSDELGEWMAYERAYGPLDTKWSDGALIAIYEQLQLGNRISAARVLEDPDDIPAPVPLHPPTEYFKKPEDMGLEPDEEEESEWEPGDDEE